MKNDRFVFIQNRLNLVFTVLFLVGVLILAGFIGTSIRAMSYNAEARTTYTQVRQLYQVAADLQQLKKAVNDYELTADYDMLPEYNSSYARLQQSLANIAAQTQFPDEKEVLDTLAQDIGALREDFDRVIQAVDAEDWEAVTALNEKARTLVQPIADQIDGRIQVRSDILAELRGKVDTFATLSRLIIALALPAFIVAIVVVAWIVARQIHGPLIRLTDELEAIEEERFEPGALAGLAERRDEVGYLTREFLQMASAVFHRRTGLQQEAEEIRAKIR